MAGTRTHALPHGVAVDRTAESATAVLRDWDVHVTTILDDQGEVRVRAHDPRTLDAGVTLLRGNAHRALATRHYLPASVEPAPPAPPRRRLRQFAATTAVVALVAAGAVVLRLSGDNGPGARLVVMPGPTETVTVYHPALTPEVSGPDGEVEGPAEPVAAVMAADTTASTTVPASAARSPARSTAQPVARLMPPSKPGTPASKTTASSPDYGTGSGPTSSPRSDSGPSLSIVASSPSSPPGHGPLTCANSTVWTSSGCSPTRRTIRP